MCGLVGVFGNLNHKDLKYFKQALVADVFRGPHSTGLAAVNASGVSTIKKYLLNPIDFLDMKSVDNCIDVHKHCLLGHNRYATMGGVTKDNAHPFNHGAITLAHNGTLTNKYQLEGEFLKSGTFATDSELVCFLLDNFPAKRVIESLEGAYALTWYDSRDKTLNVASNGEREFSLAVFNDRVLWGSEEGMVDWLITRNSLDTEKYFQYELEIGKHMAFKYEKGKIVQKVQVFTPKKTVAPSYNYTGNAANRYNPAYSAGYNRGKSQGNNVSETKSVSSNVVHSGAFMKNIEAFNTLHGTKYKPEDEVYGYIQSVKVRETDKKYCDIVLTLACDPYCDVHLSYTKYDPQVHAVLTKSTVNPKTLPYAFKTRVRGIRTKGAELSIIGDTSWLYPVYDHKAAMLLLDKWAERSAGKGFCSDVKTLGEVVNETEKVSDIKK